MPLAARYPKADPIDSLNQFHKEREMKERKTKLFSKRRLNSQRNKQTDKQTDKQADRHINK